MNEAATKLARVKVLKNGRGLQELIDKASEIFGNPILMIDLDYKVVANLRSAVTDDPIWNELVTTGHLGQKTIEMLKEEQFIELAADSQVITFLISDKLKYDRIYGKINNQDDVTVGSLIMVGCFRPFDEGDPAAFEALCRKLSKEVSGDSFYQDYGRAYIEKLINLLIDGAIEDKLLYPAYIEILYHGMKRNLFLAAIDISRCDNEYADRAYCKTAFWRLRPDFKYATYSDYIVALISSDKPELDMDRDLRKLNKLLIQNNMSVGISGCFENLFELQRYYNEALDALKGAR